MKFCKYLNIIICLFISKFVSAILIDDFSDQNRSAHLLNSGTEVNGIQRLKLNDKWRFEENQIGFRMSENSMNLRYTVSDSVNFDDLSILKFNIARGPGSYLENFQGKIMLIDKSAVKRTTEIDLQDIWKHVNKGVFSIDLRDLPFQNEQFNRKVSQDAFNLNEIRGLSFTFNTYTDTPVAASLYLDSIEAIPEPFSIITLAGGTIGFIRKKYRKNK